MNDAWLNQWEPPLLSAWVEAEFGRGTFANAWEAYAGGLVIDVYSHRERADHAMCDTLDMLHGLRFEARELDVNRGRGAIKFLRNGGGLLFTTAAGIHQRGLEGLRPSRVDAGTLIGLDFADYLRSRGVEVW